MKIIEINKMAINHAEMKFKFTNEVRKFEFSYSDGEIFTADFPEELRKLLRLLPTSITHSLIEKIENHLTKDIVSFPFEIEIEI